MKKMLFFLMMLGPAVYADASIITVDDDGPADCSTIGCAMAQARSGDTVLVKPGTYNENVVFDNKSVTLTSKDPADDDVVATTIITSASDYAVRFDFGETSDSMITGFTITGRGIHCNGSSPTIFRNVIRDCSDNGITGINAAAPLIQDNTITSNSGAGISRCDGRISKNVISHNIGRGGIYKCSGDIIGNEILNNFSTEGGGGINLASGSIIGNVIRGNETVLYGGGVASSTGAILENIVVGNKAGEMGGGLYFCIRDVMHNIIAGNQADQGGGLESMSGRVHNNTIVGNRARIGGGIYNGFGSIKNNIIAFNEGGDAGGIDISFDHSYNSFWANVDRHFGDGALAGVGDGVRNPLFAQNGYWDENGTPGDLSDDFWVDGDYHLMSAAGRWDGAVGRWIEDVVTSECIDAGQAGPEWMGEFWPHGALINAGRYGGTCEASGSLSIVGNVADLDLDGLVDFRDMLLLYTPRWPDVQYLLGDKRLGYTETLLRKDMSRDGHIDFVDYAILTANWQPFPPPTPNPMVWAEDPCAISPSAITMLATSDVNSSDGSGVEYYFEETSGNSGGDDSAWQINNRYTDGGLSSGTTYSYRVKIRNVLNVIEGRYSEVREATTWSGPRPDPVVWLVEPFAISQGAISMTAGDANSSDGGGVEYYFAETSGNPGGTDSGWQDEASYTDTGLSEDETYCYTVRARNKGNEVETAPSEEKCATTPSAPAPTPDPATWQTPPYAVSVSTISMVARAATSGDGSVVQYRFERAGGVTTAWQVSPLYTETGLDKVTTYCYRVQSRNSGNLAETQWSDSRCATTPCDDIVAPYFPFPPGHWEIEPCECRHSSSNMSWWVEMQVAEAVEDSDTVYYYFECKTNSSLNSGWQTDPCYEVFMGRENQGYSFRVKARDECGNESSWSSYVLVRRCQPNGLCFQKDCDGL